MIIESGSIPRKDACFQCYNPPVFYAASAVVGTLGLDAGIDVPRLMKLLQFACCMCGLASLGVCLLILKQLALSDWARWLAFATVCVLPRHVYLSAMHSNDTLCWLLMALSVYVLIHALEKKSALSFAALGATMTLAIFTKYTALVILPAVFAALVLAWHRKALPTRLAVVSMLAAFLLPVALLTGYMLNNVREYGEALPWNVKQYDPSISRPRDAAAIDFVSFKPWEDVETPMLAPGKLHSFWTLLYSGMWFDTEPYFVPVLDPDQGWWRHYYSWYRGEEPFPGENTSMPAAARLVAAGLIVLGLGPLFLIALGCVSIVSGRWARRAGASAEQWAVAGGLVVLLACTVAMVMVMTVRLPSFTTMKPSYLLGAAPALLLLLGAGIAECERRTAPRRIVTAVVGALAVVASTHVLWIGVVGVGRWLGGP